MTQWLLNLWHTMYVPAHGPFYNAATWGNVFVIAIVAPLGWLWSRTKFWPLRPLHRAVVGLHAKIDAHREETRKHRAETAMLHDAIRALNDRHDEHDAALASLHRQLELMKQ